MKYMAAYCFMSTEKIKSFDTFNRKMNHNYRLTNVPNADPDRIHDNEEIIKMEEASYVEAFKRKMIEAGHTPRSNAVLGIEVMLTYNARDVDENFNKEQWKQENKKWLEDTFGKDNVISAVLHNDEGIDGSGHIHAIIVPMVDGKLNCKHFLSGKQKLIELQTSYGQAMSSVGLKRGMEGSVAKHQDIRKFYDSLNKKFEKHLPPTLPGETTEQYRSRADDIYLETNLKHLEEVNKMKRKIDEVKTSVKKISIDERLDFQSSLDKIEKEKERIRKEKEELKQQEDNMKKEKEIHQKLTEKDKETLLKVMNMDLLRNGLANYPDKEFAKNVGKNINKIVNWQVEQFEKKIEENNNTKKSKQEETI